MKDICVVFVCNSPYLNKFKHTCSLLIQNGKYKGDICLVVGDDLKDNILSDSFIIQNNIQIKYFPNIKFSNEFLQSFFSMKRPYYWNQKIFQYHKLYLFDTFFKKWKYIFYLDSGITIYDDIYPIIQTRKENKMIAHSDAYPFYEWKLHLQFEKENKYYEDLSSKFDLNNDYFQTTIMLYDTDIIKENTFNDLYQLSEKYPISRTNDQGIISLYFTQIHPYFEQIPPKNDSTYFYDYLSRNKQNKYIMLKM